MTEHRDILLTAYSRARGVKQALPLSGAAPSAFGNDINEIVESVREPLGAIFQSFRVDTSAFYGSGNRRFCGVDDLRLKLDQFISFLELNHHTNSQIVQIGTLFNSIQDGELKSRCSDLLSAAGNFDRAINQATLVLEDRIRIKSGVDGALNGVPLVNAVLNSNPARALLKVSDDPGEQEGIGHICRGLMLAFRNPTHHQLTDQYSREDAFKVCAFIDNILKAIDGSTRTIP